MTDDDARNLTRLRADPTKVRVAVRRTRHGLWCASVHPRHAPDDGFETIEADPAAAVFDALLSAEGKMPGIDLGMEWAYWHPQATPRPEGT